MRFDIMDNYFSLYAEDEFYTVYAYHSSFLKRKPGEALKQSREVVIEVMPEYEDMWSEFFGEYRDLPIEIQKRFSELFLRVRTIVLDRKPKQPFELKLANAF